MGKYDKKEQNEKYNPRSFKSVGKKGQIQDKNSETNSINHGKDDSIKKNFSQAEQDRSSFPLNWRHDSTSSSQNQDHSFVSSSNAFRRNDDTSSSSNSSSQSKINSSSKRPVWKKYEWKKTTWADFTQGKTDSLKQNHDNSGAFASLEKNISSSASEALSDLSSSRTPSFSDGSVLSGTSSDRTKKPVNELGKPKEEDQEKPATRSSDSLSVKSTAPEKSSTSNKLVSSGQPVGAVQSAVAVMPASSVAPAEKRSSLSAESDGPSKFTGIRGEKESQAVCSEKIFESQSAVDKKPASIKRRLSDEKRSELLRQTVACFSEKYRQPEQILISKAIPQQFIGKKYPQENPLVMFQRKGIKKNSRYLLITDRQILYYNENGDLRRHIWGNINTLDLRMTHDCWQNGSESCNCRGIQFFINGKGSAFLKMCSFSGNPGYEVNWLNSLFNYWAETGILTEPVSGSTDGQRINRIYSRGAFDFDWRITEEESQMLPPPPPREFSRCSSFLWFLGGYRWSGFAGGTFVLFILFTLIVQHVTSRTDQGLNLLIPFFIITIGVNAFLWIQAVIRCLKQRILRYGIVVKAILVNVEDLSGYNSSSPDYKMVWQYHTANGKTVTIHTKSQTFDLQKSPKERFLIYDTQTQIPTYFFLDELRKKISFSRRRGFYF